MVDAIIKKIELKLSERLHQSECCGLEIDRDLNVSINLRNLESCCLYVPVDSMKNLSNEIVGNEAGSTNILLERVGE